MRTVPTVTAAPDPRCRWCHGTGRIALAISVVPCDCVAKPPPPPPPAPAKTDGPRYQAVDFYRGPAGTAILLFGRDARANANGTAAAGATAAGSIVEIFGLGVAGTLGRPPTGADFGFPALGSPHPHLPALRLVRCEPRGNAKMFLLEWA